MADTDPMPPRDPEPSLPARAPEGHKGDFGRILVAAGSRRFAGAGALCSEAALRSGAGLVTLATATSAAVPGSCAAPIILEALPETHRGEIAFSALKPMRRLLAAADLAVIGPGLAAGNSENLRSLLRHLLRASPVDKILLDAAALRVLTAEEYGEILDPDAMKAVLTPHPGEAAALLGTQVAEVQRDRRTAVSELANRSGAVVVLKGAGTLIGDGRRIEENSSGHDGMATAGSGDVLCGIIAGLWGRGMNAFDAARLGVRVHGEVGDALRRRTGRSGLTATELLWGISEWFGENEA